MKLDESLIEFSCEISEIDGCVNVLVLEVVQQLDDVIKNIEYFLKSGKEVDNETLEKFILDLPAIMYHTISQAEKIITKEAIAKLYEREKLAAGRKIATGTISQKQDFAERGAVQETLIHTIYYVVNKSINKRLEAANEMLQSCKKILTLRISEAELSNNKYSGSRRDVK